jgi:hypothetical protein
MNQSYGPQDPFVIIIDLFHLYLTRFASWEQVLINNCDLAKIKQSSATKNNNTELHINKCTVNNTIEKSIYSVCKWVKEVRQ